MVEVGWGDSVTGKHVGSAEIVGYLQEEGNANGNALTHLPIHQGAALCFLRSLIYVVTFLSL